jgi:adenylosuccinate lyase
MNGAGLLQSVFCRHWLYQPALELWRDRALVETWIRVEQALAQAQAEVGLIPLAAAERIADIDANLIDWAELESDIAHQVHPFTPVLHQLERICGGQAAGYLHWGATTQNIFDTANALQLRSTLDIVGNKLDRALKTLAELALQHAKTPQAGRTHGQHALPISFGLKVAGWHAEIQRHAQRLQRSADEDLVVVMGGGVGSFSAMEGHGRRVQAIMAQKLGLADAGIPLRSMVDRFAHIASLMALLGNTIEKIAREIVFMQRTEIDEASEAHHDGKMGSSTMAQKRNPSQAMNLITLAYRLRASNQLIQEAMVCENEGFASHANLTDTSIAEASVCVASLAAGLDQLIEGIEVNTVAMQRNLNLTNGLIVGEALMMQVGRELGRHVAHHAMYEITNAVVDQGVSLEQAIRSHPALQSHTFQQSLGELIQPSNYMGESAQLVSTQVASMRG